MDRLKITKFVLIPLLIFFLLSPNLAPFAQAFSFPERYDLVAILVEQGLYSDTDDYDGLSAVVPGPLKNTTIKRRVDRYAIDVQNALPGTRAVIIQVDRFEKPQNIAAVLERLYFDGDPKEPNRVAYLRGVVVVGDVPLPVVNKKENRFISMFPYTDFEQKAYVWNPATQDFEFSQEEAESPQPEIWHGVIRPPVSTTNLDGRKLVAAYLDKNHLYHLGDARYTTFDKKVFFQDFFNEKKNLNPIAYKNYLNFLAHQSDIAYFRYTKELFKDLAGPAEQSVENDVAEGRALTDELANLGIPSDSFVPSPQLPDDTPQDVKDTVSGAKPAKVDKQAIPDIMTKIGKMSDNLMMRFSDVFTKYPNLVNDFVKYTGRYITDTPGAYLIDVDSAVNLITAKDQYTISYLKAVNTMLESKIDSVVNQLQKNTSLFDATIEISNYSIPFGPNGDVTEFPAVGVPLVSDKYSPQFTNFTLDYGGGGGFLNGSDVSDVSSVSQCTPYRGSQGIGAYSKAVEINRALDLQTASNQVNKKTTGRTPQEVAVNYQCRVNAQNPANRQECVGLKNFAGCFYDGLHKYENYTGGSRICFPERATDQVLDFAGTQAVKNPPANFDNFQSCYTFREKKLYEKYLASIDRRLAAVEGALGNNTVDQALKANPLAQMERGPNDIQMFNVVKPFNARITLGDVLRGLGWDSVNNPNGWREVLGRWLTGPITVGLQQINLANHPNQVKNVKIQVKRTYQKSISSVMYHKEPTAETITAQAKNLVSKDLPVDNPRYVTFQNQNGGVGRITYPDVFKAQNVQEFLAEVAAVEAQLNALPRVNGNDPAPCAACLEGLISVAPESVKNVPKADTILERANSSKITDAVAWKNMDIDAKHDYLVNYYLDAAKNPYVGKSVNGYEIAYLNGEGSSENYEFSVNVDVPEETDASFMDAEKKQQETKQTPPPYEDDPDNPFDDPDQAEDSYLILSFSPPGSPWFVKMKEWAQNLKESVTKLDFAKDQEKPDPKKELEEVRKESSEVESALLNGDEPVVSKIRSVSLDADSLTLVGNKKADVTVTLKDADGKMVNDEFTKITLSVTGAGHAASDVEDGDPRTPAAEITMMTGSEAYGILADGLPTDAKTGWIRVAAQVDGTAIRDEVTFAVVADAKLVLSTAKTGMLANGSETTKIDIATQDNDGRPITNISGTVKVAVSDKLMGQVQEKDVKLVAGKGTFTLKAGKKAGKLVVNATMSSVDSGTLAVELLPGAPKSIQIVADKDAMPAIPGGFASLTATIYDENGNAVNTNSAVQIDFRISKATDLFGTLSSASEKVKDGVAHVRLSPREQTGTVNVIAESKGLATGVITVKSVKRFGANALSTMKPDSLVVALLGIPAGDVTQDQYLGGWFAMNGRTQAAVSVTSPVKQYAELFSVNEHGGLSLPDPGRVSAQFVAENNFSFVLRDTTSSQDLARVTLYAPAESQFDVVEPDQDVNQLADGIYLQKTAPEDSYTVDKRKGALRFVKNDQELMEVQTNGFARILDNAVTLVPASGTYLTVQILDAGTPVGQIIFVQHFNQDVRVTQGAPSGPGVYIQPLSQLPQIRYRSVFSGNSTAQGKGVVFSDISGEDKSNAPGFGFQSLEDSLDRFGVGFTEDNKFALLFAAGETFGEANRPYASDIGIVLGDPTVRIDNREPGSFSSDTGKLAYAGTSEVQALLNVDYNNDGLEDILIAQEDGKVRLLQNNGGYDSIKDQGYLFDIKNGIQDITKADVNNDGKMDVVVAAKESCTKTDTCIDIYRNDGAAFTRVNLRIPQKEKVTTLRAEDLNNDRFVDLVFADTAGDIKVLYNRKGTFDTAPQIVGNVGLKVDPAKNLVTGVLVNYPGLAPNNIADPILSQKYQTLSVKVQKNAPNAIVRDFFPTDTKEKAKVENAIEIQNLDFIYADLDAAAFSTTTKFGQDLNGGVVQTGDRIRYTISLKNNSASTYKGVSVSDAVSEQLQIDPASVKCAECEKDELQQVELDGDPTRPILFRNITVPVKSVRTISYEATFAGSTDTVDKVSFIFNNQFDDTDANLKALLQADSFPDIAVTKEGNPTGRVRYFYTTGVNKGTLSWASELSSPPMPTTATELKNLTGLDFPDPKDLVPPSRCMINGKEDPQFANKPEQCRAAGGKVEVTEAPPGAKNKLGELTEKDNDGDGVPNSVDDIDGALDDIADVTSGAVSALTCSGGCIPMPVNMALLAPGFFSVLGIPTGFDVGLPVFGWGVPGPIPTYPPMPFMATMGGRFYISPSLTGGIGFGICLGTYGTPKNCYSFGINPLDLIPPGVCDKINGAVSGVLSTVTGAVSKINEGTVISAGGSGSSVGSGSRQASGSGLGNYSLGSYDSPTSKSRNIRTPGFPSVITSWWARQMEEFTDKILNLPDIYLIYPEGSSLIGAFKPTQKFSKKGNLITNIINYLNSLPILDIQTQPVIFKIPIITRDEIEKLKSDAREWIADERAELTKFGQMFGCVGTLGTVKPLEDPNAPQKNPAANPDLCKIVTVDMGGLISSVSANMKALDEWILFPKKILQYRAIESYYLTQIIQYLDTIIQYSGGWIKKNVARLELWKQSIQEIKNILKSWQGILDLMIDYNESCDKCNTERFSLKDLILKLFMAIPSPPVIPMPKLPDFVIDVSRVQAGIRMQWPDIQFQKTPITLPKLPRISLGADLNVPLFKLSIPKIPVIPPPPQLPNLPSLPPLNLPKLPDIPPPPKLPGLPKPLTVLIDVLKKVVKILCIIRMGFIPTDEMLLKARIEEITARGLSPLIPLDTMFTIQSPTIPVTYVDQLKITAFTNFQLDVNYIQKFVEDIAAKTNGFTTNLSGGINKLTDALSQQIQKATSPELPLTPQGPEGRQLNYVPLNEEEMTEELSAAFGRDMSELAHLGIQMRSATQDLENEKVEQEKILAQIPDQIRLDVISEPFVPGKSGDMIASQDPEDLVLPFQQKLKQYRDSLAAYVQDTDRILAAGDALHELDNFSRMIAETRSPFMADSLHRFLADTDVEWAAVSSGSSEPVNVGKLDLENVDWLDGSTLPVAATDGELATINRLLAELPATPPQIPLPAALPGTPDPNGLPAIQNTGIFFIDPNGKSKRLVNYTLESDRKSSLSDIDIENDGDLDKVYSYGPNVFLKRNDRIGAPEPRTPFRPVDLEFWTIFELLPKGMSQNAPRVLGETSRQSSLTFNGTQMDQIQGYEVVAKRSPYFFESPRAQGNHESIREHLVADPAGKAPDALEDSVTVTAMTGQTTVNDILLPSELPADGLAVQLGDQIQTKEGSSLTLRASDGTTLVVSENTTFILNQGGPFVLVGGNLEVQIPKTGSLLFTPGERISTTKDANVRIRFFDGSDVNVDSDESISLMNVMPIVASVTSVSGSAMFEGNKRDYVGEDAGVVHLAAGDVVHPLQVSGLTWDVGGASEKEITMSKNVLIPIPPSAASGMNIEVQDGMVEIIRSESALQAAANGMALTFGDALTIANGSATVQYQTGAKTTIPYNERFILNKIETLSSPTLSVDLDPAFYFTKIYAFDDHGNRSNASEKLLLAPQVCGDTSPPTANFGKVVFQVAVGKTLSLDASRSFDTDGKVVAYNLDTDSAKDTNPDGVSTNDPDISNNEGNTQFVVGPFTQVADRKMRLTVKDEAGNEGYQDITVQIITPQIVLEAPPLKSGIIQGFVKPPEVNVPISIARFRPGPFSLGWEIMRTLTADAEAHYFTDEGGKFQIKDLDLRDRLVVRNSKGEVAAEINRTTGRITITDARYETRILPLDSPFLSPRIGVFLKTDTRMDRPLAYSYFVPDVNVDTTIDGLDVNYGDKAIDTMAGVHIKPLQKGYDLGFNFKVLSAVDPQIPGATLIHKGTQRIAAVDVNADILRDDTKLAVREKFFPGSAVDLSKQPVIFELVYRGDAVAELFVAAHGQDHGNVEVVDFALATPVARPKVESPFTDIDPNDPFAQIAANLFKKGVIAGYPSNERGKLLYKPDNQINRAEFTQITEKMLCIIPREEAKRLPTPFYDVADSTLWFYPVLKEGNIRGFIRGYLGEAKNDPVTGALQTPFKPASNITRGEAVTVVLAALQEEDVIDLSKADFTVSPGGQWYEPYMRIGQDLKPYLKNPSDANVRSFLITKEESLKPDLAITRRDFAIMADRVLLFYNCFMEKPIEARPEQPNAELSNAEGIFVARPACNICPCYSTVGQGADLQPGDIIFAAITGKNGLPIYAKSNEETY